MEKQQNINGDTGAQGNPTSDRAFSDHKEDMKQKGISNGGGQRSNQTSNRDNERKHTSTRSKLSRKL